MRAVLFTEIIEHLTLDPRLYLANNNLTGPIWPADLGVPTQTLRQAS